MHIGLLQCDLISSVYADVYGQYSDMFHRLFHGIEPTIQWTIYDVINNYLPPHLDACDAYLITGSQYGVNDDYAWIRGLEEFICHLKKSTKKLVGVCFGHQLIAKALGGKVISYPQNWGIGMSINELQRQKEWMKPTIEQFNLLVSHQDQVVILPPNTEVLAGSAFCPYYMLQVADQFLTIQGHPEFTKDYCEALILKRKAIFEEDKVKEAIKSLELNSDSRLIAQWIVNFLTQYQ